MYGNRKYPIGIQDFATLREGGYVYADKTALIHRLVCVGQYYFLCRPRRFGKSLLVSTLKCLFEGRRDLFRGLAIDRLPWDWTPRPVIHLDFGGSKFQSVGELQSHIDNMLAELEQRYGLRRKSTSNSVRLINIIRQAFETSGNRKPAVLVDEYDAPMFSCVDNSDAVREEMRMLMRDLLSPLKSEGERLEFVLITGITKLSQMSVFSELNNLNNISMQPAFDGLCGITEEELTTTLLPDIELLAQAQHRETSEMLGLVKQHYDGYHFTPKMVDTYNPFSLLHSFFEQMLGSYWFASGTPTFLIKLIRDRNLDMDSLEGIEVGQEAFDVPIERFSAPVPLLYQCGYLTIKAVKQVGLRLVYTLGFPNTEVRIGFASSLVNYILRDSQSERSSLQLAFDALAGGGELADFVAALQAFFAGIPYELSWDNMNEHYFHSLLYTLLVSFGADVTAEQSSALGRPDIVLRLPQAIYVIELKLDHTAGEALGQIRQRGYADRYAADGRTLWAVGLSFSSEQKNIGEWKAERL